MESEETPNRVQQSAGIIALVVGLILLGFGLWALGGAIYMAWGLFQEPESVSRLAAHFLESTKIGASMPGGAEGAAHMVAWLFVITLLLVLGKLGDWAIGVGARLMRLGCSNDNQS